jgi:protein-disulfide isomerase
MASRKEQKEQARATRLAQQEAAAAAEQRKRRIQIFGGAIAIAVIVIVVAIVISTSGGGGSTIQPESAAAKTALKHVNSVLSGIPQSGNTLGNPKAKVTITEYGDLECSVCDVLATPTSFTNPEHEAGSGWEDKLISQYVRTGKAKLVYKSLETASGQNPDTNAFQEQQVAAEAAGLQGKEWYFVELMYNQQGAEGDNYVTESYLQSLAKQIPGLNFKKWMSDRKLPKLQSQLSTDSAQGVSADGGASNVSTPTVVISGPRGAASPILGLPTSGYNGYVTTIKAVG